LYRSSAEILLYIACYPSDFQLSYVCILLKDLIELDSTHAFDPYVSHAKLLRYDIFGMNS
jgi:hypothetical protein